MEARVSPAAALWHHYFAIVALGLLTVIEALHMIFVGSFNSEVFAGITLVIGTILGAFFGVKG